ncbi:MAG TPA: cytochrome b5 domain-containing protein [Negativicutes bacterium]|nr:cytochrome b5 domain-containing protein [Negativicutes bacterium]
MVKSKGEIYLMLYSIAKEADKDIDLIYRVPCIYGRNAVIHELAAKIKEMTELCEELVSGEIYIKNDGPTRQIQTRKSFTAEELKSYNGKGGNPAYVAVNGTVYDVTNNPAWAAGTHFGQLSGKDLSTVFLSCHPDPSVLAGLPVIGELK